jgi:hypothetical protein
MVQADSANEGCPFSDPETAKLFGFIGNEMVEPAVPAKSTPHFYFLPSTRAEAALEAHSTREQITLGYW